MASAQFTRSQSNSASPILTTASTTSKMPSANVQRASTHSATPSTLTTKFPEKTYVGLQTLKQINDRVRLYAYQEPKKQQILKECDKIADVLSFCREDYDYQETKALRLAFREISRLFKHKELAELTFLTAKMLKTTWFEKLKEINKQDVINELSPFGEPGGSKTRTISASLGTGFSALPIELPEHLGASATVNAGYACTHEFAPDDEGLFFETIYHAGSAGGGFNANAKINDSLGANFNVTGSTKGTYLNGLEYNGVKDYADTDGTKLYDPDATRWQKLRHRLRRSPDVVRLKKEEQFVATSAKRFGDLLRAHSIKSHDFVAPFPEQPQPLKVFGYITTASTGLNAGVKLDVSNAVGNLNVSAGGGASYSYETADLHQPIPYSFYDVLSKNPEKLKEIPRYLLRRVKKYPLSNHKEARKLLREIRQDIQNYYSIVRDFDYQMQSGFGSSKELKRLKRQKHALENKWGAVGRHHFIQTALASIGYIHVKQQSFKRASQNTMRILSRINAMLDEPQIKYSKRKIEEIAYFQRDAIIGIDEHKFTLNLQATIFEGSLTVAKRHRSHVNFLREGDYIDINLIGKINLDASDIFNIGTLSELISQSALAGGIPLPDDFSLSPDIGVDGTISLMVRYFKPEHSKKDGFPGKKGWRKQFTRYRTGLGFEGSQGVGATVAPGFLLSGSAGVSTNETRVYKEVIASDDIIFPMMRYNRMYRINKREPYNQDWFTFAGIHKKEFRKLFLHLANRQSNPRKEIEYSFDIALKDAKQDPVLTDKIKQARQEFNRVFTQYGLSPSQHNYKIALDALTTAFSLFVAPWWRRHESKWGEIKYHNNINGQLKFKRDVKTGFGLTGRGRVKFN